MEPDGGLNIHTYYQYDNAYVDPWEVSYSFFGRSLLCGLPRKCEDLGVCEKDQCVACPTPRGLRGWSDRWAAPALTGSSCSGEADVRYYKVKDVMHFSSPYYKAGEGCVKLGKCRAKCTRGCECRGFLYDEVASTCLLLP